MTFQRHLSEQGKMAINDVEAKTGETALHAAVKGIMGFGPVRCTVLNVCCANQS